MLLEDFLNLLFSNSKDVAYSTSATGIMFVGIELSLRFRAERRLQEISQAESQIKLLKIFTELMDIAQSRKYEILLKPCIQALKNLKNFNDKDIKNLLEDYLI
jgi:hypothetical protein